MLPDDTRREAEALVGALASRNRAPALAGAAGEERAVFANDYSWTAQACVQKVIARLSVEAEAAWPALVAHMEDNRYAASGVFLEEKTRNLTVGEVCKLIAQDWLSAGYLPELPHTASRSGQARAMRVLPYGGYGLRKWCVQRAHKKLYELQIEMCENAIPLVEGLTDSPADERHASVGAIGSEIRRLAATKKARRPAVFYIGGKLKLIGSPRGGELRELR